MKSFISTPVVNKENGDVSYVHVPLEAAFGVGNVLYMTSSADHISPNTPTADTQVQDVPVSQAPPPEQVVEPAPVRVNRLTRLFQMVGLRR